MKAIFLTAVILLLATAPVLLADADLVQNGIGIRTKPILGAMYELSLEVPPALKGVAAKIILEADQPMGFNLVLKSSLITRVRFIEATSEGFAKAAENGYASDQSQTFLRQFDAVEFRKGDVVKMHYANGALVTLYQKSDGSSEIVLGTIPGLGLKQALFAIWLGEHPVQDSLKASLLGLQ